MLNCVTADCLPLLHDVPGVTTCVCMPILLQGICGMLLYLAQLTSHKQQVLYAEPRL